MAAASKSNLVPIQITDINGVVRTVYVKPDQVDSIEKSEMASKIKGAGVPSATVRSSSSDSVVLGDWDAAYKRFGRSDFFQDAVADIEAHAKAGKTPIIWGDPGKGKSAFILALGTSLGLDKSQIQHITGGQTSSEDIAGLPVPADDRVGGYLVNEYSMNKKLVEICEAGEGLIFIDEIGDADPRTQAALQLMLNERKLINGMDIPDGVLIVGAGNMTDTSTDGYEMSLPMRSRVSHETDWNPPQDDLLDGVISGWGKPEMSSRERIERAKTAAFLKSFPAMMHKLPTDDDDSTNPAYPTLRSWDNCAETIGSMSDQGIRRIDANDGARRKHMVAKWVGDEAAAQYSAYERQMDMPDPDDVLRDPKSVDWAHSQDDRSWAIMGSVIARVHDEETRDQANQVFLEVAKHAPDVGAVHIINYFRHTASLGLNKNSGVPRELATAYQDVLKKAGLL